MELTSKLPSFIKDKLPFFQFAAVVLTIGLGGHKVLEEFSSPEGPVLEFDKSQFKVSSGSADKPFRVVAYRAKYRDDCSFKSFNIWVIDAERYRHDMRTTTGKSVGKATEKFEGFAYFMNFPNPNVVAVGKATLEAVLVYECPEGQKIHSYPDGLEFEVTE